MSNSLFVEHTSETAPEGARRAITATQKHLGYLPVAVARMAGSPQLLEGFQRMSALFDATTLEPVAREVVVMAVATRNGCHLCVAMHSARLRGLGAGPELIRALAEEEPLDDAQLDAVRRFTLEVLDTAGAVADEPLRSFLAAGYTARNALEVVLGVGAYTMSTFANRMTRAPIDEQLAAGA